MASQVMLSIAQYCVVVVVGYCTLFQLQATAEVLLDWKILPLLFKHVIGQGFAVFFCVYMLIMGLNVVKTS